MCVLVSSRQVWSGLLAALIVGSSSEGKHAQYAPGRHARSEHSSLPAFCHCYIAKQARSTCADKTA